MTDFTPWDTYDRYSVEGGLVDQMGATYQISNGNGQSDKNAIAHALTSAALHLLWGRGIADVLALGREVTNTGNTIEDSRRDVYNNIIGFQIARYVYDNNLPEEAIPILVNDALNRGLLIVNENTDSRLNGSFTGTIWTVAVAPDQSFDGVSSQAAAQLEALYGLPAGSLLVGDAFGEGQRTFFLGPDTSPRPLVRPAFERDECFHRGTPIRLPDGTTQPIETILPGDIVFSYDSKGTPVPGRVTRTFRNEVSHLLDVHGLKVTPGHATLCGDGMFKGRHVPIIDILLSDGALVRADGILVRMAINAPVGSAEDAFVKVAYARTPEDMQADALTDGEMRVGTLLFDRDEVPVSVLDCLTAEGYAFDPETGLIAKPGEVPHALFWFGRLPRPEDYILTRSQETLEGILTDGEWDGSRSKLIVGRLRQTLGGGAN
jgi:murein DD-endopeptidase MepM/ murein hydrolase activator NlpD